MRASDNNPIVKVRRNTHPTFIYLLYRRKCAAYSSAYFSVLNGTLCILIMYTLVDLIA